MTLLEKSQQLFSVIREQPSLVEIRKLVVQFKSSEYGIANKIYPTPILGLLLLDPQKIEKNLSKPSVDLVSSLVKELLSWDADKKYILFDVGNQIFQLNELCIEPFTSELPNYTYILNPYSWYPQTAEYYKIKKIDDCKNRLFSANETKEIVSIFQETPAFKYALSILPEVKNDALQIHCERGVLELEENLINAGARKGINIFGDRGERNLDIFQRYLIGLLCIKDSLSNLNQLIYQAIIQDKLTEINRDEVFDYLAATTESGLGIAVKYLIKRGETWGIELNDLIILNLGNNGIENQLCHVVTLIWGGQFSDTNDIEAKMIDENLNAYGKLIRKITNN